MSGDIAYARICEIENRKAYKMQLDFDVSFAAKLRDGADFFIGREA